MSRPFCRIHKHPYLQLLTVAILFLTLTSPVAAQTSTWTGNGGSGSWQTANNWLGNAVPVNGNSLIFDGTNQLVTIHDLAPLTAISSITLPSSAGSFSIAGNPLTITGGSAGIGINLSAATNNLSLSNSLISIVSSQTWLAAAARTIAVSSPLSLGANTLTLNSAASTGIVTLSGPVSGSGSINLLGGTLNLTGNNNFTGQVFTTAGTITGDYNPASFYSGPFVTVTLETPFGSNANIAISGGTLAIRAKMQNDSTAQVLSIGRGISLDKAPGTLSFDRITSGSSNKTLLLTGLTFAAPSASNNYSLGQYQLTLNSPNAHRFQFASATLSNDTLLTTSGVNAGEFTFTDSSGSNTSSGGITGNGYSLVKTGNGNWGFVGGTHSFTSLLFAGTGSNLRVGSMVGTTLTSNTVTLGSGPVFLQQGTMTTFRNPSNIASTQIIEITNQAQTQGFVNFEFNSVTAASQTIPTTLRVTGPGGVFSIAGATGFQDIAFDHIGDGTMRIGANGVGATTNTATIAGVLRPGRPAVVGPNLPYSGTTRLVRLGATGTLTLTATNALSGPAGLDVGSPLFNGGFYTFGNGLNQNGTVILTAANSFIGGTTVNPSSTLDLQSAGALGTGAVSVFGTLKLSNAGGSLASSVNAVNLYGGSTLSFDNSALTTAASVNRWSDSTPIVLLNSTLSITGVNNASPTIPTEVVGRSRCRVAATRSTSAGRRPQSVTHATFRLLDQPFRGGYRGVHGLQRCRVRVLHRGFVHPLRYGPHSHQWNDRSLDDADRPDAADQFRHVFHTDSERGVWADGDDCRVSDRPHRRHADCLRRLCFPEHDQHAG